MKRWFTCLIALVLSCVIWGGTSAPAYSQPWSGVHPIGVSDLSAPTAKITFDEFPEATYDPVYQPADYGAGNTAPTLRFKSIFAGQNYSTNDTDCKGANPLGCIMGNPTSPLALSSDRRARGTQVIANPFRAGDRSLGTQQYAAYSVLFDKDVASVGLTVGPFDAIGSTAIKVFDREGHLLGQTTNQTTGDEFFGFATDDQTDNIAGVQVSMLGPEAGGYVISDISLIQQAYQPPVVNHAPIANAIAAQTATELQAFDLDLAGLFSDPDGDTLSLIVVGLPGGLSFDGQHTISGTPTVGTGNQTYQITVTANDGKGGVTQTNFELKVNAVPAKAYLVDIDPKLNRSGATGVALSLPPGKYQASVIGTSEGGEFDAWSSRCECMWKHDYSIRYGKVLKSPDSPAYATEEEALNHRPADEEFTLKTDMEVRFYVFNPTKYQNNEGGVSLELKQGDRVLQIINLNARKNYSRDDGIAVALNLPAGTYQVHVIGRDEGGAYDAWSTNCKKNAWYHEYTIEQGGTVLQQVSSTGEYKTAQLALDKRPAPVEFTVGSNGLVKFYTYSPNAKRGCNGVSLQVKQIQ